MAPPGGSMSNSFSTKGNCTADNLLAASGVHQLIANHQQILSETVYRSFEVPLLHELDQWQRRMEEEEVTYQKEAKAMSKEIRKMEKEGLRLHKQRKRDVGKFREHLVQLTMKLDSLTGLSGGHSRGLLRDCQEMSKGIVDCSAGLVRAEVDIFEALARKGWNGGGLDELLEKGKDFFANETDSDAHPNHGAKIFSILPQNRSILAHDGGEGLGLPRPLVHARSDSLLVEGLGYQSLAAAVSGKRDADVNSIFSERDVSSHRSRAVRPFSPTPGERVEDPLNHPLPTFGLNIPTAKSEPETSDTEDLEQSSVKTIVPTFSTLDAPMSPKAEAEAEAEEEEHSTPHNEEVYTHSDEYEAPTLSLDLNHSRQPSTESEEEEETAARSPIEHKRERRWSVTDDGNVSDD